MLRVTAHWERPSLSAGGSKTSFSKSVILKKKKRNGGACFCPVFCKCAQHLGIFSSKSNFLTKKNLRALNFQLFMTTFLPPTPQKVKTLPWKEREFPPGLLYGSEGIATGAVTGVCANPPTPLGSLPLKADESTLPAHSLPRPNVDSAMWTRPNPLLSQKENDCRLKWTKEAVAKTLGMIANVCQNFSKTTLALPN